MMNTCTPYQVGNVPVKGEHCAWMESSAVIYINSVLGARTNAEGRESTGAAMLTGKIPYWGLHIEENRHATHLIELDIDVKETSDWGLLGYYIGDGWISHRPDEHRWCLSYSLGVARAEESDRIRTRCSMA